MNLDPSDEESAALVRKLADITGNDATRSRTPCAS
jgi:hypothetical protein